MAKATIEQSSSLLNSVLPFISGRIASFDRWLNDPDSEVKDRAMAERTSRKMHIFLDKLIEADKKLDEEDE